jgi:hypothetical protein
MPNFQEELADLKRQLKATRQEVAYLRGVMTEKGLITPGWDEVLDALHRGDSKPLAEYLKRGGKVPEYEPETKG